MASRDEFAKSVTDALAKRVGVRCSNPGCRRATAGPRTEPTKTVNIGVAAHITAASAGGPRYSASLTAEQRSSIENAIWLCQNCAKLVDNDSDRYTANLLGAWKARAEEDARAAVEGFPEGSQLVVNLTLEWRRKRITSERHDYQLNVFVQNVGQGRLQNYYLEVEVPTDVLIDLTGRVEGRSDNERSLFRQMAKDSDEIAIANEKKKVRTIASK